MKSLTISILAISLIGCGATSNPPSVTPPVTIAPNPQQKAVDFALAAAGLTLSCSVGEANVSAAAYLWLTSECPQAATAVRNLGTATGTLAQFMTIYMALQASYAAIPAGTLSAHDQQVIGASLSGFQGILVIYQAAGA